MARRDGDLHALMLAFEPGHGMEADRDAAVRAGRRFARQIGRQDFVIERVATLSEGWSALAVGPPVVGVGLPAA